MTMTQGKYRFRLATASTVIFTSEHDYDSKGDCMAAIKRSTASRGNAPGHWKTIFPSCDTNPVPLDFGQ